jgi:S-adenosylmethionine:tRNA ribosyltransferase-isomerase
MRIEDFDFELPPERIAQKPLASRDSSKLLLCAGAGRLGELSSSLEISHRVFRDLPDLLDDRWWMVTNDAKVLPVRILGHREGGGGAVEALLLRRLADGEWNALLHMSARARPGLKIVFEPGVIAEVLSTHEERVASEGEVRLRFGGLALERNSIESWLERHGHVPLPPYIERADTAEDKKTYQTVYAARTGSAAAPTAGFHFTPEVLRRLEDKGVKRESITLHVGLGTFRPIKAERIEEHKMHEESFEISPAFAEAFRAARAKGKRLLAIGTTVVRALESWAIECEKRGISPGDPASAGVFSTRLFITPRYKFRAVDDLVTNFHLPRSSLLVLVGAAMGIEGMQRAYRAAVDGGYRFFSYGDAMLIIGDKGKK